MTTTDIFTALIAAFRSWFRPQEPDHEVTAAAPVLLAMLARGELQFPED
jgi:hypothetical protein